MQVGRRAPCKKRVVRSSMKTRLNEISCSRAGSSQSSGLRIPLERAADAHLPRVLLRAPLRVVAWMLFLWDWPRPMWQSLGQPPRGRRARPTSRRVETRAALLRYLDSTRRVLTGRNRDDERRRFCRFLAATATHRYAWHLTCSRRVLPGLNQAESDACGRQSP
jgi:hypothetical protein